MFSTITHTSQVAALRPGLCLGFKCLFYYHWPRGNGSCSVPQAPSQSASWAWRTGATWQLTALHGGSRSLLRMSKSSKGHSRKGLTYLPTYFNLPATTCSSHGRATEEASMLVHAVGCAAEGLPPSSCSRLAQGAAASAVGSLASCQRCCAASRKQGLLSHEEGMREKGGVLSFWWVKKT